uniref:TolC family protein n=1 Tax=Halomonas sp. TaxID=1486246 RepID=UPI00262AF4B9|nr:TolC family protein [Halomonas sp.]
MNWEDVSSNTLAPLKASSQPLFGKPSHRPGSPGRWASYLRPIALAVALASLPVPAWAISLVEAVNQGLEVHPEVLAAEAEVQSAETRVDIAKDSYWPSLSMSAGPENILDDSKVGYEITATQVLYDWGNIGAQVDGASAEYREKLEALKVTSDEAALDIIEIYLDVLAASARLNAVEDYEARLAKLQGLLTDRDTSGYSDRSESDRATLEVARANEQLSVEMGALDEARQQFRVLVEASPYDLSQPPFVSLLETMEQPDRLEQALLDAPALQRSHAEVDVARSNLDQSRAKLKPQLNLEGSLLNREIGGNMEDDQIVALRLRMEPIQGLSNWREVDSARQRLQAAEWTKSATQRDIRRNLDSLLDQRKVILGRIKQVEQQISSSAAVVDTYREQFQAGFRDIADILSIERERFEAERQKADLAIEKYRLEYQAATQLGMLGQVLK